jgi:hypothetical protein
MLSKVVFQRQSFFVSVLIFLWQTVPEKQHVKNSLGSI